MNFRKLIPKPLKLQVQLFRRFFHDLFSGTLFSFAKKSNRHFIFNFTLKYAQIIKKNSGFQAKLHNLKKASKRIENVIIYPNEIFSFWYIVKKPSKKNNYKPGRTIINGVLTTSSGGGLCQLSGLVYRVCLEANLEILERHNHSLDLYEDATRYYPLGSDATVVYGYKDLRFRNNFNFPIHFCFVITKDNISIHLKSTKKITKKEVVFKKDNNSNSKIKINTIVDGNIVATSIYKRNTNSTSKCAK